jgi:hypothetical protein
MRNFFNQDQKTNSQNNRYHCSDPKDVPIVVHTQDWLKAKPDEPPVEGTWHPSSPDYNPLDYFMWSEFEREVHKQPHNTLASLKARILEVMTNTDREIVILPCQRFCCGGQWRFNQTDVYVMCIQMFPEIFIQIYSP